MVKKKSPSENSSCQVICPTLHPLTHSKSVWTASLFFSVLVVPCYFGCFNPAMAARSANNNANVFLYFRFMCQHTHQDDNTKQYSRCLSPRKPDQAKISILSAQLTTLFSLTISSKLSFTGPHCYLVTVLQLNFTVWQNQVMGTVWNPITGSFKNVRKSKAILNIFCTWT